MRLRIGVIGQSGKIQSAVAHAAAEVGRLLAEQGAILLSGGRDGVMEAASRGARAAGGLTVGILPGSDPGEGNPYLDVAITTGFDLEWRSLVLVHTCDAIIMIAGGNGTLGEASNAYLNGVPVIALNGTGGWAERLRQAAYESGRYLDGRRSGEIHYARTPAEAVESALRLAEKRRREFAGGRSATG